MGKPTQKALGEKLRAILQAHAPGTALSGEEEKLVLSVCRKYMTDYKGTAPPVRIRVELQPFGRYHEFQAVFEDGSTESFGYKKAIKYHLTGERPKPTRSDVMRAFRGAIAYQVLAFKDRCRARDGSLRCEITGRQCADSEVHVDHVGPTFAELVESYCQEQGRDLMSFVIVPAREGGYRLAERGVFWDFAAYHRKHARLRLLHRDVHKAVTHEGEAYAQEVFVDRFLPPEEGG